MTTATRALAAGLPHEGGGPYSSPWGYQPGRVLHGFQLQQHQQQQQQTTGSSSAGGQLTPRRAAAMVSKSLLSARLMSRGNGGAPEPAMHTCSESEEEADQTDDGCYFEAGEEDCGGDTESWSWLPAEEGASVQDSDRSSLATASSQPIAIPASCYFKDEMQRAALDKLNQKRQWYQQQLEAERMMARSMAKSRQQAAAAVRRTRPAGRPGAPA